MRLQARPIFRAGTAVLFDDVFKAAEAVRVISQAWLFPANVRLLDSREAFNNGFGDGQQSVIVLAFENADHPVDAWMDRALAITRDFGGKFDHDIAKSGSGHRGGAAEAWRNAFIRMPHYMKIAVEMGIIIDTFESAITWERFPEFYKAILSATEDACLKATGQRAACLAASRIAIRMGRHRISRFRQRGGTAHLPSNGWKSRVARLMQ